MIILGIDPGSVTSGFGLIEYAGGKISYLSSGIFSLGKGELADRLHFLHKDLSEICLKYRPDIIVVESLFININWRTSLVMAHARGIVLLASSQFNMKLYELQPRQVKKMITGNGNASKILVRALICKRLGISEIKHLDASDALALALCFVNLGISNVKS